MKEKIISLLKANGETDAYSISIIKTHSEEAFFIGDSLDMNRGKDVEHISVTVYKDFEENGEKYRGSAAIKIPPEMTDKEIKEMISQAVFAAKFVKNKWYPLPEPSAEKPEGTETCSCGKNSAQGLVNIKNAIYSPYDGKAKVNSCEIFRNENAVHIINSEGIDVKFNLKKDEIEVITESGTGKEPVEIYGREFFADADFNTVKAMVQRQLKETDERAAAEKAKHLKKINVIITNAALLRFFGFYYNQASSSLVYNKSSAAELGKNFQGENIKGDKISISLVPDMQGSAYSAPYDSSGFPLKRHELYKDGIVKTFHGGTRFAHYLNIEPTGAITNFEVSAGTRSAEDLKKEAYVEILTFSDFFMDDVTGNFGGEFRLARYFDGEKLHLVNNGSISGNMFEVQKEFYFSKEILIKDFFKGPKFVLIPDMEVLGE